jgi:hypothetical protein
MCSLISPSRYDNLNNIRRQAHIVKRLGGKCAVTIPNQSETLLKSRKENRCRGPVTIPANFYFNVGWIEADHSGRAV